MRKSTGILYVLGMAMSLAAVSVYGQRDEDKPRVRTVSIPISIFSKTELEQGKTEELLQIDRLIVRENNIEQTLLSIRSRADVPLSLAILVQDDLSSDFNLHLRDLARFVRGLPRGSRVMVAYINGGSLSIRQRFTEDLEKASNSFRVVFSDSAVSPRSPYDGVSDALNRFDALPAGRRAILLLSNGLDLSSGLSGSSPGQSLALQAAILKAQRKSVAVFSIYASTVSSADSSFGALNGQGSLSVLADETGGRAFFMGSSTPINFEPILKQLDLLGRAFFMGSSTPINFEPILKQLDLLIGRQFLLSYLSTNMKKGYYKVSVTSTTPDVKIEHPRGYYYR